MTGVQTCALPILVLRHARKTSDRSGYACSVRFAIRPGAGFALCRLSLGQAEHDHANMAQESALLQSLQVKQQLGVQALAIANQAPQTILSLFGR